MAEFKELNYKLLELCQHTGTMSIHEVEVKILYLLARNGIHIKFYLELDKDNNLFRICPLDVNSKLILKGLKNE